MRSRTFSARFWVLQVGIALAWIGAWHLGRILEETAYASLWFPPAGLTFAAFLTLGRAAFVPVMVGAIVTTFQSAGIHGDPRGFAELLGSGVAFGSVHASTYGLGAWAFDRIYGDSRLNTPQGVVGFLLLATLSAFLGALGGLWILAVTGSPQAGLSGSLIPWWVGDLVGVVTLAPLLLVVIDAASRGLGLVTSGWLESLARLASADTRVWPFALKLGASLVLALVLAAGAGVPQLRVPVALVVYTLIIPLMWIAHTEGGIRTVVAVAALATVIAVGAWLFGSTEQAFNYQAAMIAIGGTGLFNLTVPKLFADNRRLRNLITFDQLSGARTRPVFFEAADEELERARRDGATAAVIAFDVDGFKSINDTFGHAVGDRVLAMLGDICRAELRGVDVFGRLGGDEFAVLVPGSDMGSALAVAERVRAAFEGANWTGGAGADRVTASFGVARVETDDGAVRPALDRADRALYEAKRSGRNRVCAA